MPLPARLVTIADLLMAEVGEDVKLRLYAEVVGLGIGGSLIVRQDRITHDLDVSLLANDDRDFTPGSMYMFYGEVSGPKKFVVRAAKETKSFDVALYQAALSRAIALGSQSKG